VGGPPCDNLPPVILAIDQGTTGTTCLVFDADARLAGRAYREFQQHFPRPGWVEHDAAEIWETTRAVALEALDDAGGDLEAVGITNQRETVCVWDPKTGEPLSRALVWQDRRTAKRCDELRAAGHEPLVRTRTGLVLDPYFSATKIEWLLANVEGLRDRAEDGRAVFGTIDAWLVYKLTGEHRTDVTNASRTMLFDIERGGWDDELLALFGDVPRASLPEALPSIGEFGTIRDGALGDGNDGVPVAGIAGDQQAALYGQGCLDRGLGKNTYGTGSFVLMNSGDSVPTAPPGLLATIAWGIGERTIYALEAAIFITGAGVQWLRDGLGIIEQASDTEELAASLDSNDGVYFVPALTGLGSPHWDPYARGTIVGLTRGSTRAHFARATLEAMAFQTVDAVQAMERVADQPLEELRADGGATENRWLMQFQADVLNTPVAVAEIPETTALGAALLAGVGIGAWTQDDVATREGERARYEPRMGDDERYALIDDWRRAVQRARGWAQG
jgi:glycerol kinase